jgi:hypothetical protein
MAELDQICTNPLCDFRKTPGTPLGKIENKDLAVDSILRFIGMNMFNDSTFRPI